MDSDVPRFLQINTFYPDYLAEFYLNRPQLEAASYDAQIEALLDDGFSDAHIFTRPLRAHGFQTMQIIANNPFAQRVWLKERGFPVGEKVDCVQAALLQIKDFAPDIFYTTDVVTLHSGFVRALEPRPPVVAGWRGFPLPSATDLSAYDLILTSFDRMFDEAKAHGAREVERFHPGFPEDSPILSAPRDIVWDVVISGSVTHEHKRRIEVVNMIVDMSQDPACGFSLGLFIVRPDALSPAAQRMNKGARWGVDMLRLLRNARIVVNIDVDSFDAQPPNMRLIEATGAGTLLITSYHPELSRFFEPGVEIETFRTPQELASKILYYVSEPVRADEIAQRGQARCLKDHARSDRAKWFADIMTSALSRQRLRHAAAR